MVEEYQNLGDACLHVYGITVKERFCKMYEFVRCIGNLLPQEEDINEGIQAVGAHLSSMIATCRSVNPDANKQLFQDVRRRDIE